ncbi:RhoA inhibitor [Cotia virus SPAn232]|uniref:RhoA inhibitor n=2 Tax=Cotia virus TaxID=39444 RepID=A0A097IVM0_9POXV|nr:RhoA inhibitor [Cotia virus SPAn232]AFB76930.1 RhoA inhibitor [Cotia virus SPAn232]AIT70657.1 RhoA inhibitor [Cotia virus]
MGKVNSKIKRYCSYEYIKNDKTGNRILNNDIYIGKLSIDDKTIASNVYEHGYDDEYINDNYVYSWKNIRMKNNVDFLLDNDGFFEISDMFIIKLSHGNGFLTGTICYDEITSFISIICIKNDGISGIYIRNSILKHDIEKGDHIITRSCNGIRFLPHIGGDAIYIITIISPSNKLKIMGFISNEILKGEDIEKNAKDIGNLRKNVIFSINDAIKIRDIIEKEYIEMCMINELKHIYILYNKNESYNIENDNCIFSNNFKLNKELYYDNDNDNNIFKFNNDLNKKQKYIEEKWNEFFNISLYVRKLLDDNIKHYNIINKYMLSKLNISESFKYKNNLITNLCSLSNTGFTYINNTLFIQ